MSSGSYIGSLGSEAPEDSCDHTCSQCGKGGSNLMFDMTRRAEVTILRDGKLEHYRIRGLTGTSTMHAELVPGSGQVPLPPPPPEVWLVYKHGGSYDSGDPLQGIYSSEEGAKDSVRFSVKEERASLARRLGQPETPHEAEEPVLRWQPARHWRYGQIPGEFYAEAGLANYVVKSHQVPGGYLPQTTWCKVPMEG
jgi:hypothetical protein